MIDKHLANELLDFYDPLLTHRQQEVLTYYYREDLSLSEISENLKISKSAVSDIIRRVENILLNYEDKLQLLAKHKKRLALSLENNELREQLIKIEEGEDHE